VNFIKVEIETQIKVLAKLASEIWHEYWPCILSVEQIDYMVEKFQSYNAIKNQMENENYFYFLLEDNNIFLGYVGISVKKDNLFLSKLYIRKEYRGCGCGKLAFKKVLQLTKEFNKEKIILTVNKNNINTIKAYEKWGFKIIDAVVSDIGNGFVMDDFIMEYQL
jgi:ribosomal protein S18 acetylase RimI-like enzyme